MTTKPLGLIIEDNEDQNWVFTTALQQAGYETESIADGLVARRRLLEVVPSMIVLDLHIPHIDGEDLLRQIRSDRRLSKVRVVLATADAVKAEELQPQADLVLLKPISFSQLTLLAGRLLQNP
jgi:CheY-like chemotaxis protein